MLLRAEGITPESLRYPPEIESLGLGFYLQQRGTREELWIRNRVADAAHLLVLAKVEKREAGEAAIRGWNGAREEITPSNTEILEDFQTAQSSR